MIDSIKPNMTQAPSLGSPRASHAETKQDTTPCPVYRYPSGQGSTQSDREVSAENWKAYVSGFVDEGLKNAGCIGMVMFSLAAVEVLRQGLIAPAGLMVLGATASYVFSAREEDSYAQDQSKAK
jgi:hypothetical protein